MARIKEREAARVLSAVGGQGPVGGQVTVCSVIAGGSVTVKGANVSKREYIAVPSATVGMLVVKITKHSLLQRLL
jgi:hypothetical protein